MRDDWPNMYIIYVTDRRSTNSQEYISLTKRTLISSILPFFTSIYNAFVVCRQTKSVSFSLCHMPGEKQPKPPLRSM